MLYLSGINLCREKEYEVGDIAGCILNCIKETVPDYETLPYVDRERILMTIVIGICDKVQFDMRKFYEEKYTVNEVNNYMAIFANTMGLEINEEIGIDFDKFTSQLKILLKHRLVAYLKPTSNMMESALVGIRDIMATDTLTLLNGDRARVMMIYRHIINC